MEVQNKSYQTIEIMTKLSVVVFDVSVMPVMIDNDNFKSNFYEKFQEKIILNFQKEIFFILSDQKYKIKKNI
jgi:hypothetical protein